MVANQLYELCEAVGPEPTRSVQIRSFKYSSHMRLRFSGISHLVWLLKSDFHCTVF